MTSSPEIDPPKRTPPFIAPVNPPTYQVVALNSSPGAGASAVKIEFDVYSEDLGQPLVGVLLLDFPGFSVPYTKRPIEPIGPGAIPPGHINEKRIFRSQDIVFDSPGCHSITVILTHEFGFLSYAPKDPLDVNIATWWFDVDDNALDNGNGPQLQKCASGGAGGPDAGLDAGSDGGGR